MPKSVYIIIHRKEIDFLKHTLAQKLLDEFEDENFALHTIRYRQGFKPVAEKVKDRLKEKLAQKGDLNPEQKEQWDSLVDLMNNPAQFESLFANTSKWDELTTIKDEERLDHRFLDGLYVFITDCEVDRKGYQQAHPEIFSQTPEADAAASSTPAQAAIQNVVSTLELDPTEEPKVEAALESGYDGGEDPIQWLRAEWKKRKTAVGWTMLIGCLFLGLMMLLVASSFFTGKIDQAVSGAFISSLELIWLLLGVYTISTFLPPTFNRTSQPLLDAQGSVRRFTIYFIWLLVSWIALYLAIDLFNVLKILKVETGFDHAFLLHLCNNIGIILLYGMFRELNTRTSEDKKETRRSSILLAIAVIIIFASVEGWATKGEDDMSIQFLFALFSGIIVAASTSLFIGRLTSKILPISDAYLFILVFYIAIQPAFAFISDLDHLHDSQFGKVFTEVVPGILILLSFFAKMVLFLILAWQLKTNSLLYFMIRIENIHSVESETRNTFLAYFNHSQREIN